MKNLFLTIALMCCVSFAFANEKDDSKKDAEMPEMESKKLQENFNSNLFLFNEVALKKGVSVTECFGLSCTTHCTILCCELTMGESIKAWEELEAFWCGG